MTTEILTAIPASPIQGTVYLLNFPAAHTPGLRYVTRQIDGAELQRVVRCAPAVISAIGHEGAAQALSAELGLPVPMSRIEVGFRPGDTIVCAQLRRRLAEGQVLGLAEMQTAGYDLVRIDVAAAPVVVIFGSAALALAGYSGFWRRETSDIDVIFANCDAQEAGAMARRYLSSRGVYADAVELDMHSELANRGPDGQIIVTIPHAAGTDAPPIAVVTGNPTILPQQFDTLPAVIRLAAGRVRADAADAGAAGTLIGRWIAEHGAASILLVPHRHEIEDGAYVGNTLAAIRSAVFKLEQALRGAEVAEPRYLSAAVSRAIDAEIAGGGELLSQLVVGIDGAVLPVLRRGAPGGAGSAAARFGVLRIARDVDGTWSAGPVHSDMAVMDLVRASRWLTNYGATTTTV